MFCVENGDNSANHITEMSLCINKALKGELYNDVSFEFAVGQASKSFMPPLCGTGKAVLFIAHAFYVNIWFEKFFSILIRPTVYCMIPLWASYI